MMLLILTTVMGYELKTAVGTSVFIMTFTALTGAISHFMIGGFPNLTVWILCILFTLVWARIAALFMNKATPKTLNRATGIVLVVLGIVIFYFHKLKLRNESSIFYLLISHFYDTFNTAFNHIFNGCICIEGHVLSHDDIRKLMEISHIFIRKNITSMIDMRNAFFSFNNIES